ncbi:MAG: methyltransferase domain-containing protein [Bdellovibrionales bacterium]|nr:methyltransferase domain-containing protein [Bdellovibrionales bacterium]
MSSAPPDDKPWSDPSYWDARFREGDTPWDTGSPSPVLVGLWEASGLRAGSAVLVPGCGWGNDVVFFAREGCVVSAVDWSPLAALGVRSLMKGLGFEGEVLAGSFWDIPEAWFGTFDAVAEHTFFCAIDPSERPRYVEQLARLLKPGGRFLGSLFLREEATDAAGRHEIFPNRVGPPFWSSVAEIQALFSNRFEILRLDPTPHTHPRVQQTEWAAHFRLRG